MHRYNVLQLLGVLLVIAAALVLHHTPLLVWFILIAGAIVIEIVGLIDFVRARGWRG